MNFSGKSRKRSKISLGGLAVTLFIFFFSTPASAKINYYLLSADKQLIKNTQMLVQRLEQSQLKEDLRSIAKHFYFELSLQSVVLERRQDKLTFILLPYPIVSKVKVSGNKSFSKKELLSAIGIEIDSRPANYQWQKMAKDLTQFYQQRGFFQTKVDFSCQLKEKIQQFNCQLKISEGKRSKIKRLYLSGASSWQEKQRWLEVTALSRGQALSFFAATKAIASLRRYLRARGYLRAKIAKPKIIYDRQNDLADLLINVERGPKIELEFEGNGIFSDNRQKLKAIINWSTEHIFSANYFIQAAEDLKSYYRQEGYHFVEIDYDCKIDQGRARERHLFKINRGPRIQLEEIDFAGVKKRSLRKIRTIFYSFDLPSIADNYFFREDIDKAILLLEQNYRHQGFLKAHVKLLDVAIDRQEKEAKLKISVNEGPQLKLATIEVKGGEAKDRAQISSLLKLRPGSVLKIEQLEDNKNKIIKKYRAAGYLLAEIKISTEFNNSGTKANLTVELDKGQQVTFGNIFIQGNRITKDHVIRREVSAKRGELYSEEKIADSQRSLQQLGIFRAVEIRPLKFDAISHSRDLLVVVHERKQIALKFRTGFGSEDGVRGAADIIFNNIGGTARVISGHIEVSKKVLQSSSILEDRFQINYLEPKLLGDLVRNEYNVDGRVSAFYENDSRSGFDLERLALITALDKRFGKRVKASFLWDLEYREPFNIADPDNVTIDPLDEERSRLASLGTILTVDYRNNALSPTNGFIQRAWFNVFDNLVFSEADFYQLEIMQQYYLPIYKKIRFALELRAGFSKTFGRTAEQGIALVPLEKRFRLGGHDSIRGFPQDSIGGEETATGSQGNEFALGGNSMFNYMAEFIFPLWGRLEFVLFSDGGETYLSNTDFNPLEIRTTAGFGLRYQTPVGPLRIEYGFVLDRRQDEGHGQLHFTVGNF